MSKSKHPEFKRHFYLNWFVQDWLGDTNLKLCPPQARALWMDMLMNMVLSFPYGHLSRLSKPLMKESDLPLVKKILVGSLVYQNSDQTDSQRPDQEDDQWVQLSVGLNLHEQLRLVVNIEDQLSTLTPYPSDMITESLGILDDMNIFSRTKNGIIYSRRMVRDFQKRKIAFINACRGVNPYEYKPLKRRKVLTLLHQNTEEEPNQSADQQSDQPPNQSPGDLGDHLYSNSNSNSNSTVTTVLRDPSIHIGNGSSIEKGSGNSEKKAVDDGRSGSGPAQANGKIDFSGLKQFKEDLIADQLFMESFFQAAPVKLTVPDCESWLDLFNLHCVTTRKLEKDYHEYVSHFKNWFFKGDRTKKPPTKVEIQQVKKSAAQSKELLAKYGDVV